MKYHRILKTSALLLLMTFGTALHAQNMSVTGFRLLENDLTANRYGTSKTDQNDETAALIKIVTPETGFSFDGGALGIVAAEQKPGKIWLYMPRLAQRLTISHRVFGVLRSYVYPIPSRVPAPTRCCSTWAQAALPPSEARAPGPTSRLTHYAWGCTPFSLIGFSHDPRLGTGKRSPALLSCVSF